MQILITGATGFVGLNLIASLLNNNLYEITLLVRDKTKLPEKFKNVLTIIEADLTELPDNLNFEIVIHLAAVTRALNYDGYWQGNVIACENLISRINKSLCKQFIYISSQSAIGPSTEAPLSEECIPNPICDYGKTKLIAEEMIKKSGLAYTILRPCSIYGPGSHEFLAFFKLMKYRLQLVVGNGQNYINMIYIDDFIQTILLVMNNKNSFNNVYHICDGVQYSWLDLYKNASNALEQRCIKLSPPLAIIKLIAKVNGLISRVRKKAMLLNVQKLDEMLEQYQLMNNHKFCTSFNFKPRVTLNDGFKASDRWYRQNNWL